MSRKVLDSLLPEGAAWEPASGDDYDLLLDGIAANTEAVKSDLNDIQNFRNPDKTVLLPELENDFGQVPFKDATEAERRQALKTFIYNRSTSGAYDALETKLRNAGFDVYVHVNSPAVDPSQYLNTFSAPVGELAINSPEIIEEYPLPADSGYWPLVFFVGGAATRDGSGFITSIALADVPIEKRRTFKEIILKHKPLLSWGVLYIGYTDYLDGDRYLDGTWYLDGYATEV